MSVLLTASAAWNLVYGSTPWFGRLGCEEGIQGQRGADTSKLFVRLETLLALRQRFTGRGSYLGSPTASVGALVLV